MLSIGELSKATSLTVKAIRLYHEAGLLLPSRVDPSTGYRYYDRAAVERARVIVALRGLDFSVAECADILGACEDEADLLAVFERQRAVIEGKLAKYRGVLATLERIIRREREANMSEKKASEVVEKALEPVLVAGIRVRGRYGETGALLGRVARAAGRHVCGAPLNLYYDGEHREDDADFEACFPVRKAFSAAGIEVHELPGGPCLALVHVGAYDELGRSYAALFEEVRRRGLVPRLPTREVYLKGPGMVFRGNPKKYLTEIQIPVEGA